MALPSILEDVTRVPVPARVDVKAPAQGLVVPVVRLIALHLVVRLVPQDVQQLVVKAVRMIVRGNVVIAARILVPESVRDYARASVMADACLLVVEGATRNVLVVP